MHTDDLRKAAIHASGLLERLSRISEELGLSNRQAADALKRTTEAAPELLRQAAQYALRDINVDTVQTVRVGLNGPLEGFSRHVADNVNHINGVISGLTQSQRVMAAVIRKLHWLIGGVLAALLIIVVAGGGLLWHYGSVIAESQIEANLMQAYNQADVRLCDGRLCARVERADKRYGDYVPVKPRAD